MNDHAREIIIDNYQARTVRVSYEDMANPLRVGYVVEHRAGEFRIMWDDEEGGETWSDLRQAGWRPANFWQAPSGEHFGIPTQARTA